MPDRVVVREVPTIVVRSAPGPQGPPGTTIVNVDADDVVFEPTGSVVSNNVQAAIAEVAAEAGAGSYVHNQTEAASIWPVYHNLGRVPVAYVVESTGDDLEPGRDDPDQNTTNLDFDGVECTGIAYFS